MWAEAFFDRWWPPTGSRVHVTLESGETVSGRVAKWGPWLGEALLGLEGRPLIDRRHIVAIEVADDQAPPVARGEAAQAAAPLLVAPLGGGGDDAPV